MSAIQSRMTTRSTGTEERPLTVRDAALFLGVSPQTVYLWVERKQIPHLRVMWPQYPVPKIGSRALPRNFQTRGGVWHDQ